MAVYVEKLFSDNPPKFLVALEILSGPIIIFSEFLDYIRAPKIIEYA